MVGDALLDTNVVIALLKAEPAIVQRVAAAPVVHLPAVVVGELCFGAQKSKQVAANLQCIDDLVARSVVLACDLNTARTYGQIKQQLQALGMPIPDNDIWIAAIARQHSLRLLTRDQHFQQIVPLDLELL